MAIITKCDKCGKEIDYENRYFTSVAYDGGDGFYTDTYDLCSECSSKLRTLAKHFIEKEETNHDTEMTSIPTDQYDSLNRMIAHYSDESERFKKCIDTIAESNKKFMDENVNISKAILEAKLGIPLAEAMVNFTSDFLKEGDKE